MSSLVTRFLASSDSMLLSMEVFYNQNFGYICITHDGVVTASPPAGIPLSIWLRCLYRFNRVVSQMIKPVEDGTEKDSSI